MPSRQQQLRPRQQQQPVAAVAFTGPVLPPGVRGNICGELLLRIHYLMWLDPSYYENDGDVQVKWWGHSDDETMVLRYASHTLTNADR